MKWNVYDGTGGWLGIVNTDSDNETLALLHAQNVYQDAQKVEERTETSHGHGAT
jgi:hypothetical protein